MLGSEQYVVPVFLQYELAKPTIAFSDFCILTSSSAGAHALGMDVRTLLRIRVCVESGARRAEASDACDTDGVNAAALERRRRIETAIGFVPSGKGR